MTGDAIVAGYNVIRRLAGSIVTVMTAAAAGDDTGMIHDRRQPAGATVTQGTVAAGGNMPGRFRAGLYAIVTG